MHGARRWLVEARDGERLTFRTPDEYREWVKQGRHHAVTILVALPGGADRKDQT